MKKRGLGKGLEALLKNDTLLEGAENTQQTIDIETVVANPFQPRKTFSVEALAELAASIRQHGIIQPLVVRQIGDSQYELIAGERRLRAAKEAGLNQVPVVIHNVSDEDSASFALIENIQREDLNVIEKARGIKKLSEDFSYTHEQCAKLLGQSRSSITNLLRLLELEDEVQQAVIAGRIDMGHARALLGVEGALQHSLLQQIGLHGLTVRETEALINQHKAPRQKEKKNKKLNNNAMLASELTERLGVKASVRANQQGQQKVTLTFASEIAFREWLKQINLQP